MATNSSSGRGITTPNSPTAAVSSSFESAPRRTRIDRNFIASASRSADASRSYSRYPQTATIHPIEIANFRTLRNTIVYSNAVGGNGRCRPDRLTGVRNNEWSTLRESEVDLTTQITSTQSHSTAVSQRRLNTLSERFPSAGSIQLLPGHGSVALQLFSQSDRELVEHFLIFL